MRRNSEWAEGILAWCREADPLTPIDGRDLERWSQERMLPPESTSRARYVAHLRELAGFVGKGTDRAALTMAARGFPCDDRSRTALKPFFEGGCVVPALYIASAPDPEDNGAFQLVDEPALANERSLFGTVPRAVARSLRGKVRTRIAAAAQDRDETREVRMHSLAVDLVHATVTDNASQVFYDEEVVATVADLPSAKAQSGALGALERFRHLGPNLSRVCVERAPLGLLSALAVYARDLGLGLDEPNAARVGPILFAQLAFVAAEQGHSSPAEAIASLLGLSVDADFAELIARTTSQGVLSVGIRLAGTDGESANSGRAALG